MAKQILNIHDITYHSENTPCPQKNIDATSKLVKPAKAALVDLTKPTPGKYVPLPLPPGFDMDRQCANYWRSGQAHGINGKAKRVEYNFHSSKDCPHVQAKRDHQTYKPPYQPHSSHHVSSPRNSYGDPRRTHNTFDRDHRYDRDDRDHRPDRDEYSKHNSRSGGQSSASSVTSSIRSQDTEVYDSRDRNYRRPHNYDEYRDNRSRSRERDSRERRDHDHHHTR